MIEHYNPKVLEFQLFLVYLENFQLPASHFPLLIYNYSLLINN